MVSFGALAAKIFGTSNERQLKAYSGAVDAINALEAELEALSDDELRARTDTFRKQYAEGVSLDELMVPAFATVREAAKRTLGQRHFDVQLIGGMVLHEGRIAEMKTGEGKTLVATLPVYLNALTGRGVHVVTVNDYLASRDADWMGAIYSFLGMTVGCIVHGLDDEERHAQYACDITYGTNNEYGFDYLRDNMKHHLTEMVQRGHYFAIVDEVDSILIDEARTPLIISGAVDDKSELYVSIDKFVPQLGEDDVELDEKQKTATLTEQGTDRVETLLREADMLQGESLYDIENVSVVHHVNQAIKAHKLFQRDRDYIVKNQQVVIIDEFTGRMMEGRRYSDGMHQALEAKEGCPIQPENQTLASVTFQNYFRLYEKLAGMTGTAATEAEEFMDIYKLDVAEIPTNVQVARLDEDDEVYRTAEEKYGAIIELIKDCRQRGQPALVGTVSIEKSELLSAMLKKDKVPHNVLNARYHEQEAQIIAQAGAPGTITIATNMAGRGTDIQLGGNADMRIATETEEIEDEAAREARIKTIREEVAVNKEKVIAAGGLYVMGTERHEARRIDNQLRGRSGRQGDPGTSKFFLSLDDDLMRIFGSERMDGMLQKLGLEEGEAIIHPWINKALEKAQKKVEARNFDIRKNLLKFDDVMNDQRKVIFEQRIEIMGDEDVSEIIDDMRHDVIDHIVHQHIPEKAYAEEWDAEGLQQAAFEHLNLDVPVTEWAAEEGIAEGEIRERLIEASDELARQKAETIGAEDMRHVEKAILLFTLDNLWRDHLLMLEHLRQAVAMRGYGQRDPLNEYKTEGFTLFEAMLEKLREAVCAQLMRVEVSREQLPPEMFEDELPEMEAAHIDPFTGLNDMAEAEYAFADAAIAEARGRKGEAPDPARPETWGKIQRNAACPCGSGKKYKHCHGRLG